MLQKTDLRFFENLLIDPQHASQIANSVLSSDEFKNLLDSKIISVEKIGRGKTYKVVDDNAFVKFLNKRFPHVHYSEITKVSNVAKYRNSKAERTQNSNIVFFRANKKVEINNQIVDLEYFTSNFGLFSCNLENLKTDKLCFVENLDTFLIVEKLLTFDFVFIHTYGRVGKKLLNKISTNEMIVFSDYDYVGLNEYLTFKEKFENAIFYMPTNYDKLVAMYSKSLKTKNKQNQIPSAKVVNSKDEIVIKIREQLFRTNQFLEQQSIFIEL